MPQVAGLHSFWPMPPESSSQAAPILVSDLQSPKQSPKADPTKISFLDLARELRDQVYDCALSNQNKSTLFELREPHSLEIYKMMHGQTQTSFVLRQSIHSVIDKTASLIFGLAGNISVSPALLQVCGQVRHEGSLIFYRSRLCYNINTSPRNGLIASPDKISATINPSVRHLVTRMALSMDLYFMSRIRVEAIFTSLELSFPTLIEVVMHATDDTYDSLLPFIYEESQGPALLEERDSFAHNLAREFIAGTIPHWAFLKLHSSQMEIREIANFNEDVVGPVWGELKSGTRKQHLAPALGSCWCGRW